MYAVLLISCTSFEVEILLFKAGIHNGVSNSNSSHFLRLAAISAQLMFHSVHDGAFTEHSSGYRSVSLTWTVAAIVTCAFMTQLLQNEIKNMNRI